MKKILLFIACLGFGSTGIWATQEPQTTDSAVEAPKTEAASVDKVLPAVQTPALASAPVAPVQNTAVIQAPDATLEAPSEQKKEKISKKNKKNKKKCAVCKKDKCSLKKKRDKKKKKDVSKEQIVIVVK